MLTIAAHFSDSFHEGGWPMYPILVLGILQILAAARYAAQPESRQLAVVRSLVFVTLCFGFFGTIVGVIHSLDGIHQVPVELAGKFALLGLGESLNNLSESFLLSIIAGLFTAVGALREANRQPADRR